MRNLCQAQLYQFSMKRIIRNKSSNKDFRELVRLLDVELYERYGPGQAQFDKFNNVDNIDTVVVGYIGNQPAGCGCFKPFNPDSIEIMRMYVKPEYRGTGIAEMILLELEKWGVEKGYTESTLETANKQQEAIRFYKRLEYKQMDNYGQYIGKTDHICMKKKLK